MTGNTVQRLLDQVPIGTDIYRLKDVRRFVVTRFQNKSLLLEPTTAELFWPSQVFGVDELIKNWADLIMCPYETMRVIKLLARK